MTVPALQELSAAVAAKTSEKACVDTMPESSKEVTRTELKVPKKSEHRRVPSFGSASEVSEASSELYCSDGEADTETVMLDHAYASTDTATSLDTSRLVVSDLSSLIENCELDAKFIESAANDTANFQHFLDDVFNDCDVPSDDIVLGLLTDSTCQHVPTKSSCLHVLPTPGVSLFSCARGSTETRLCTSVVSPASSPGTSVFSSPASSPAWVFGSKSAPLSSARNTHSLTSCSSSTISSSSAYQTSPTLVTCDAMSYSDSVLSEEKIKDLLDWWSSGNNCSSISLAEAAKEVGGVLTDSCPTSPLYLSSEDKSDLLRPQDNLYCNSCSSVSVSHQIQNGVCLHCSAAAKRKTDTDKSLMGHSLAFSGLLVSPRTPVAEKCVDDCDSAISTITPRSPKAVTGKRKSVCDDESDSNKADGCKRARFDSDITDFDLSCLGEVEEIQNATGDQTHPADHDNNNNNDNTAANKDSDTPVKLDSSSVFEDASLSGESALVLGIAVMDTDSHLSKMGSGDMMAFLSQLSSGIPSDSRSW